MELLLGTKSWRCCVMVLLFLLVLVLVAVRSLLTPGISSSVKNGQLEARLDKVLAQLNMLKKQQSELRYILSSLNNRYNETLKPKERDVLLRSLQEKVRQALHLLNDQGERFTGQHLNEDAPSLEYEVIRRRVSLDSREMWHYLSAELLRLHNLSKIIQPELGNHVNEVLGMVAEQHRSLQSDIKDLAKVDGYESWRQQEASELSDLVQRQLRFLQNPQNCGSARKLLFNRYKPCGYGCQLHYMVFSLIAAYGTQRTMVLHGKSWPYHNAVWEDVFLPVSDTCRDSGGTTGAHWPGNSLKQVLEMRSDYEESPWPQYMPPAIPRDLAPRLARLHGNPAAWWVGQFLKYLLRPQKGTTRMLRDAAYRLGFIKPVVGVHVRRTDKLITEAKFHPLEEYMDHVEEYFLQLEISERKPVVRRVFITSDDPNVITDARNRYPQYEVIGNPAIAEMAKLSTRYSNTSLLAIIADVHLLSLCGYLVCTFSSNVCRAAYEIMQTLHTDAADRIRSLDMRYFFPGQKGDMQIAVLPHKPPPLVHGKLQQHPGDTVDVTANYWDGWNKGRRTRTGHVRPYPSIKEAVLPLNNRPRVHNELELRPGDTIHVIANYWDGWSEGRLIRTGRVGLYPSFKVKDELDIVDFPTYTQVTLRRERRLP